MNKILRIFPRKTNATLTDDNVIINRMPGFFDQADEIHISVTFTYDIKRAEELYNQWKFVAPIKMGGVAFNELSGEFTPGLYLKSGFVITSRGCNNKCWFCSVWKREGKIRELKIKEGYNIVDDNLLACSESHIKSVFEMLKLQKSPVVFSGGIEAKLLKSWHIDLFKSIRLKELFCAYDTPDDLEPLIEAGKLLKQANITYENRKARCYVLIGFPKDTLENAEFRLKQSLNAGFFPFAMRYRDNDGLVLTDRKWSLLQREWANPIILSANTKKILSHTK